MAGGFGFDAARGCSSSECMSVRQRTLAAVLSPGTKAQIKAEIGRLEELREICNDDGIQKVIQGWIEEQKKKLAEGMTKDS
jgi:hypothetical protein